MALEIHYGEPANASRLALYIQQLISSALVAGRVLVFNKNGIPIGQVLLPGRDEGRNLQSTSMAIKPATNDLYMVTNEGKGGEGATICHARGFADALTL